MSEREEISLYANGLRSTPRPVKRRRAYGMSWEPRLAPVLFVCVAAIALIASGAALALTNKASASAAFDPDQPPPPYNVVGYTYDAGGALLPECSVNITNLRTGNYTLTMSDTNSFYMYNLNDLPGSWVVGDMINVTAQKDLAIGWNESAAIAGPYVWIDVHLTAIIPEFPMAVLPVAGLLAVFAMVSFRRRQK